MNEKAVVLQPEAQPVAPAITPMQMLQTAVEGGADLDKLQQLMELQERWEANEAKKAFHAAMAQFKANPPEVYKNHLVSFGTSGGKTEYRHATLDRVSEIVGAALAEVGISHHWDILQQEGGILVTCVLTHSMGYSIKVPLSSPPDTSGKKNSIQAVGSTVTYLQRYTLLSAAGIATKDSDNDGHTSEGEAECITDEQAANIDCLISEIGLSADDKRRFLQWVKVDSVEHIHPRHYEQVVRKLEEKREAKAEG